MSLALLRMCAIRSAWSPVHSPSVPRSTASDRPVSGGTEQLAGFLMGAAIVVHAGFVELVGGISAEGRSLEPVTARARSRVDGTARLHEPGDAVIASFSLAVEERS